MNQICFVTIVSEWLCKDKYKVETCKINRSLASASPCEFWSSNQIEICLSVFKSIPRQKHSLNCSHPKIAFKAPFNPLLIHFLGHFFSTMLSSMYYIWQIMQFYSTFRVQLDSTFKFLLLSWESKISVRSPYYFVAKSLKIVFCVPASIIRTFS